MDERFGPIEQAYSGDRGLPHGLVHDVFQKIGFHYTGRKRFFLPIAGGTSRALQIAASDDIDIEEEMFSHWSPFRMNVVLKCITLRPRSPRGSNVGFPHTVQAA